MAKSSRSSKPKEREEQIVAAPSAQFQASGEHLVGCELKLVGGIRQGSAKVEGAAVPLYQVDGGASGKADVTLTPAHVDVELDVVTGPWVTVSVELTIGGKTAKRPFYCRGGRQRGTLQFPFSDFGINPATVGGLVA